MSSDPSGWLIVSGETKTFQVTKVPETSGKLQINQTGFKIIEKTIRETFDVFGNIQSLGAPD